MKLRKILLFLAFILTFVTSCSDKPLDVGSVKQIPGLWKWESTCGGLNYECTYESKSIWATIEFTADGKYIEARNDTIFLETTYMLQVYDDMYGTLVLSDPYSSRPVTVLNNRLLITRGENLDTYYKIR
ncbi:MAG: hypothetical protein MUD02_07185 [Bacteroidales bacterium]|jgi:hypothetical protein|nr:hypothetical protein [Bacteroidales bacterium]